MGKTIGIDLGTTNSVAAVCDAAEPRVIHQKDRGGLLPSVLSWRAGGSGGPGAFLVGHAALKNWQAAPEDTVFCVKRLMGRWAAEDCVVEMKEKFGLRIVDRDGETLGLEIGGKTLTPVEISAEYLRELRNRAAGELGVPVDAAVITVPAYFEERQRAATRQAGELAGLRVRRIIDEPTASAIAFGIESFTENQTLVVYDLGGGTFDLSIMQIARNGETGELIFNVISIDGDNWLGGSDFDQMLVDHIVNDFRRRHDVDPRNDRAFMALVRQHAERAKILLSDEESASIHLPAAFKGDGKELSIGITIRRGEYERMIQGKVEQTIRITQRALENQSLAPQDVDQLLLVGGATRTPLIRRRLKELFAGVRHDIDPMTTVAVGASILAQRLRGVECPSDTCGKPREVVEKATGRKITYIERHVVEDESRTTCDVCGASLAAAKSVTTGIDVREPTACSLGIIAVRGTESNAFVPLIPKGTYYPLPVPIKRTFKPAAISTTRIKVPVYEATDDQGASRWQQGVVEYELPETITANTEVEVSFNLDRNRQVTLVIAIKDSKVEPMTASLKHQDAPAEVRAKPKPVTWDQELENLVRHLGNLRKKYGMYLDANARATLDDALIAADQVFDNGQNSQAPTQEALRVIGRLKGCLFESGPVTQLYLADLAVDGASQELRALINDRKKELMAALGGPAPDVARVDDCVLALRGALSQVWAAQDRPGRKIEEVLFNPKELLQAT